MSYQRVYNGVLITEDSQSQRVFNGTLLDGGVSGTTPAQPAGVHAAVVNGAVDTSKAQVELTRTDFGWPKAAVILISSATAYNTETADERFSLGFWSSDGTQCAYTAYCERSGSSVQDSHEAGISGYAGLLMDTATSIECYFECHAIEDGIRLVWRNGTPDANYKITVVLFNGDDLNAQAGYATLSGTSENTISVGFQPNAVFLSPLYSTTGAIASVYFHASFGIAADNGVTIDNRSSSLWANWRGATGTTDTAPRIDTTSAIYIPNEWEGEVTDFSATSFGITPSSEPTGNYPLIMYLALDTGDQEVTAKTISPPTSAATDWDYSSAGVTPQFGILGMTDNTAVDSSASYNIPFWGIGAFDDTITGAIVIGDDHNVSSSEAWTTASTGLIHALDTTQATMYSFPAAVPDTDGFVVDNAGMTTNGTTRYWWGAFLEEYSGGATTHQASAALNAASTATATATQKHQASAALNAAATATATAEHRQEASAACNAASTATATAAVYHAASAACDAASTATAAGIVIKPASAACNAAATATATCVLWHEASAACNGAATATATATQKHQASAACNAASTLDANGVHIPASGEIFEASAALNATATATATATQKHQASATCNAASTATATATQKHQASAALDATATATATATQRHEASAACNAASTLDATGDLIEPGGTTWEASAACNAVSTFAATATRYHAGSAECAAAATATATATQRHQASALLESMGAWVAAATQQHEASASCDAVATLAATAGSEWVISEDRLHRLIADARTFRVTQKVQYQTLARQTRIFSLTVHHVL